MIRLVPCGVSVSMTATDLRRTLRSIFASGATIPATGKTSPPRIMPETCWKRGALPRLKRRVNPDDGSPDMSEVEVLLSVDAGRVPPGTVVFLARDPEAPARILRAVLALSLSLAAVGCA